MSENEKRKADWPALALATVFGLGYAPVASGTVGTLGAIVIYLALYGLGWPLYSAAFVILLALSFFVSQQVADSLGEEDPGIVVIDEVMGYLATMFMLPLGAGYVIAGFFLFRLLDITKPWPASYFDKKVQNGFGIVLDDVVAGIYACMALQLYRHFWG